MIVSALPHISGARHGPAYTLANMVWQGTDTLALFWGWDWSLLGDWEIREGGLKTAVAIPLAIVSKHVSIIVLSGPGRRPVGPNAL